MPITRNFEKAIGLIFLSVVFFYLLSIGLQYFGTDGYSISSRNSFMRIFQNELITYAKGILIWIAIFVMTKDLKACLPAMILNTILFGYLIFAFSQKDDVRAILGSTFYIRNGVTIAGYALFGLLHFKAPRGLFLIAVWGVLYGFGLVGFNPSKSYLKSFLDLMDMERLFTLKIGLEANSYRIIDLFSPLYYQLYIPFTALIFWFVYSLVKEGRLKDISLRTIQLNSAISPLTFSIIFWTMRITLFFASFGIVGQVAVSFQKPDSLIDLIHITSGCLSIFVVGSIYRNFLTDSLVLKGRFPGWLYLFLNLPIINFPAWIYTLFLRDKPRESFETSQENEVAQSQPTFDRDIELANNPSIDDPNEVSEGVEDSAYDSPPVWYSHPLQTEFEDGSRNNGIKIILILFSAGLIFWQMKNTGIGYNRPGEGPLVSPLFMAVITLALTIWYMYDWKALIPLFIIQSVSILSIALLHSEDMVTAALGSGLVNLIVYYSLFHFDHLNMVEAPPLVVETTT